MDGGRITRVFMSKEELIEEIEQNDNFDDVIEEDGIEPESVDNIEEIESEWQGNMQFVAPDIATAVVPEPKQTIVANIIQMYQCTMCPFVTPSVEYFVQHHQVHTRRIIAPPPPPQPRTIHPPHRDELSNREMFLCGQCRAVFDSMDLCRDHMIKDHKYEEMKGELPGDLDLKDVASDEEMEDDDVEENDDKEAWKKPIPLRELKTRLLKPFVYKCTLKGCIYKFETYEKRDQHISCHLSSDTHKVRNFKCFVCGEEYKKWRDNTKHMWKSHQIDIDLLKCPLCEYKAFTSILIFRHLQIHSTVKGFVCSECSEVFSQAAQLRLHSMTHMDKDARNAGQKRWYSEKTCDICNRKFSTSKTLSKHIKTVHHQIKPFICSVCGYKSARKSSLTFHMNQHTGEKPFKCGHCEFSTRDPSGLKKHEILHTTNHPYKCKFCDYSTAQTNSLKHHVQAVHTEEYKRTMSCDSCKFISINEETLRRHKADHKSGLIQIEESSNETVENSPKNLLKRPRSNHYGPNSSVEISSDSFLPLESTDSLNHDPPLDTGGVTIPAAHSEDTQFPT